MKTLTIITMLTLVVSLVSSGPINMNPDKNGEPWMMGAFPQLTMEEQVKIDAIPELQMPESYTIKGVKLSTRIDNSKQPYFRPVFNQMNGSCSQASGIGYVYTYETNFLNGTDASLENNQFPTHYTYNFLNFRILRDSNNNLYCNEDGGSWPWEGWEIIRTGGCPDVSVYGGMAPTQDWDTSYKPWMSGFDKYSESMNNPRIKSWSKISGISSETGLTTLKQYLTDHCDGSEAGGVALFITSMWGNWTQLPVNSMYPNKWVVTQMSNVPGHAMTFAGYDDDVSFDYNEDGLYTNDVDINNDGIVDMKDWEKGALLCVNSWGSGWLNNGKVWVTYKCIADGCLYSDAVYIINAEKTIPKLKAKLEINYSERNSIKISIDLNAIQPEHVITFQQFNYKGGGYGMQGVSNTVEIGLDLSELVNYAQPNQAAKYFIGVEQNDGIYEGLFSGGQGFIESFTIVDDQGVETPCFETHKPIITNATTFISADYPKAVSISSEDIPDFNFDLDYSYALTAIDGFSPYHWDMILKYTENENINSFPSEEMSRLQMSDDDDGFALIDLPFEFPFYDKLYSSISVSTNGTVSFSNIFEDVRTEADILKTKTIAPYAANLKIKPRPDSGVFYSMNQDYIIIWWNKVSNDQFPNSTINFAAKLFSDGKVDFFYGSMFPTDLIWASGVSNGSADNATISNISGISDPTNLQTTFSALNYPNGIELSSEGVLSGFIKDGTNAVYTFHLKVTDDSDISDEKEIIFTTNGPSSIEVSDPAALELLANYPNPFNPTTTISFTVIERAELSLYIFNNKGEIVDEIFENRQYDSGIYSVEWTADSRHCSGIYYYGVKTKNETSQMRRMTLLK